MTRYSVFPAFAKGLVLWRVLASQIYRDITSPAISLILIAHLHFVLSESTVSSIFNRSQWRLKRMPLECRSRVRDNQNKENEASEICLLFSGNFNWLLLILILLENKLLHKYQVFVFFLSFIVELFLKNPSSKIFSCDASSWQEF